MRTQSHPTNGLSRRQVITGAAAALGTGGLPCSAAETSLGALAAAKGILYGASFAVHELDQPYSENYAELYRRDCRILTSELEFKLGSFRPAADTIDFGPADRFMSFAEANGLPVRAHTLIWNDALPDWVGRLGPGEVEHLLESHIDTVMDRYRGRVMHWDVVNEPIGPWDRLPGNLRTGVFLDALGESYISRSFHLAKKHAGSAKLVLNEAQTESDDENGRVFRDSLLALVRRLLAEGTPLDAIGLQSHIDSRRKYDFPRFAAFLAELAGLGLEIHITELDVNDAALSGPKRKRDMAVAAYYRDFLNAVLQVKAVTTIVNWQLADHTSWLIGAAEERKSKRAPRPLPYDSSFHKKPAWEAIAQSFQSAAER